VLFRSIIVLIAGFIGQFGKSFAKYIMERFGKKTPRTVGPEQSIRVEGGQKQDTAKAPLTEPPTESGLSKEESKLRKKELKAELKKKKDNK
jgi:hypothetical protein